jgi:hypothetical protein
MLRVTRASEIEMKAAPWPHFPHCSHWHQRVCRVSDGEECFKWLRVCPHCDAEQRNATADQP